MLRRFVEWFHQIFIALDQFAQVIIFGPSFVLFGYPMNADETISSKVGRYSFEGERWAIIAEWFIDRLFYFYEGGKLGHCFESIENLSITK